MNSNDLRTLVKECVLEVLQESLLEAFDPLSQGPNMVDPSGQTNPYPIWNSKMRKLEEDDVAENEHCRYAQDAGAGQFDPRTFGPDNVTCEKCNCSFDYNSVNEVQMGLVRCPKCKTKLDQTGRSFGVK